MTLQDQGQVTKSAAEVYEEFFVPALFKPWAEPVTKAAQLRQGDRVLDIACGTGVLAKEALKHVSPGGSVVGLDRNEDMLRVAQKNCSELSWQKGLAEYLNFENASFDAVISQFGLMFFDDKVRALREMVRVLKPGRHLAVAVWDELGNTPGYLAMTHLLSRLFNRDIASALESPYSLGNKSDMEALFTTAGIPAATLTTRYEKARFDSVQAWVHTDIKGWTLADRLDDVQFDLLLQEAPKALADFVDANGKVTFDAPAHIVSWRKPR